MKQIDFLPASYREQTVHRKANVWRVLVGVLFVVLLVASAGYQQILKRTTAAELGRIGMQYDQAQALHTKLAALRQQLQDADAEAELLTYLRHPWPRTQVLNAALAQLPDCITLGEIRLAHEEPEHSAEAPANRPLKKPSDEEAAANAKKQTAAARDLAALRERFDRRPTVLILSGTTTDTGGLQHYLLGLTEVPLFIKADLTSLESDGVDRPGALRFTARVVVRPGYNQPGGPVLKSHDKVAVMENSTAASGH